MKIILNKCFGGFELSPIAIIMYANKKGITLYPYYCSYRNLTEYKYISDVTKAKKSGLFFY